MFNEITTRNFCVFFPPKKKKKYIYIYIYTQTLRRARTTALNLFSCFFFFFFDKYNYFTPMSMVKQLLLLLFFNCVEPHQGRALWIHPWEVNNKYTTHPLEPCRLHLRLVFKVSLFYYLAYFCYYSWVSLFGIIHRFHYTNSTSFYLYLCYFQ